MTTKNNQRMDSLEAFMKRMEEKVGQINDQMQREEKWELLSQY